MPIRLCLLLLAFAWAALYLPALGDPELRGEEIRRILPAQAMLETGDWIVPRIAGEVYANKPPLINWAVAAAFALTGSPSEASARMVSALSLLALALAAFSLLRKDLDNERALLVALALLTTLTLIAKGRLIEIEALFTALFGIACFLWIRLWSDRRSPWLVWTLPYLLLGLGCLVKGPVHLLFWFPFVIATLRFAGEGKSILHPAHALGIASMLAVFLPWVVLNIREVGAGDASVGNWVEELAIRGDVSKMEWDRWLTNPVKIPGGFLPWTIPLLYSLWHLWKRRVSLVRGQREDAVLFGGLFALAFGFVAICLTPGGVPRYLMPVYPLAALATVVLHFRLPETVRERYETFGRRINVVLIPLLLLAPPAMALLAWTKGESVPLPAILAGCLVVSAVAYLVLTRWSRRTVLLTTPLLIAAGGIGLLPASQPFQSEREIFREASAEIAALAPVGGRIVVYADHEFRNRLTKHLRLLYYVREPVDGIGENGTLPEDTALLVGRPESREVMQEKLAPRTVETEEIVVIRKVPLLVLRPRSSAGSPAEEAGTAKPSP